MGKPKGAEKSVILDRRRRVTRLRLQGMSLEDISARLGWSIATISRDVQYLDNSWKKEAEDETYKTHVNIQRRKLQLIQKEAWNGFYRSMNAKGKMKEIRSRSKRSGDPGTVGGPDEMHVLVKSGAGDPRFLAIIEKAIEEENTLLRIRQPNITPTDGGDTLPPIGIEVAAPDELMTPAEGEVIDGIVIESDANSIGAEPSEGQEGPQAAGGI